MWTSLVLFLSLNCFLMSSASAYYPSTKIKVHNSHLKRKQRQKLEQKWLNFLDEEPEILKAKDKPYKIDQFCSFSFDLDKAGHIDLDTIKLKEHKNNFAYNLKAIEFLRNNTLSLYKDDDDKLIEMEFRYLSF